MLDNSWHIFEKTNIHVFSKIFGNVESKIFNFFKKCLSIVQHVISELEIAKYFWPKSFASMDQLVERLTSDPTVPGSIPRQGS